MENKEIVSLLKEISHLCEIGQKTELDRIQMEQIGVRAGDVIEDSKGKISIIHYHYGHGIMWGTGLNYDHTGYVHLSGEWKKIDLHQFLTPKK